MMNSIEITYYTDPLCCWSWGMEPAVRKLKFEFKENIVWKHRMGGLLPSWKNFSDPVNHVSRPLQMGPVWMHAASVTGMNIAQNIWHKDPPSSSYPSCIAFKSVELQSIEYAEEYLRLTREACMLEGVNIGKIEELVKLARTLHNRHRDFDVEKFIVHLTKGEGTAAFKTDLQEIKANNITRFPTLIFRKTGESSILAAGYRPYQALLQIILNISPELQRVTSIRTLEEYKNYWPGITERELQEVTPLITMI